MRPGEAPDGRDIVTIKALEVMRRVDAVPMYLVHAVATVQHTCELYREHTAASRATRTGCSVRACVGPRREDMRGLRGMCQAHAAGPRSRHELSAQNAGLCYVLSCGCCGCKFSSWIAATRTPPHMQHG